MLREEGFNSGFDNDLGAASLLRTSNTIRWRYTDEVDEDGARVPESNARIVRWSDGTMSLQVGSELFDITQQTEKGRVNAASNTGSNTPQTTAAAVHRARSRRTIFSSYHPNHAYGFQRLVQPSRSKPLLPCRSTQTRSRYGIARSHRRLSRLHPCDTQSETHRRIAKALRFQKTARVVATAARAGALDPEVKKLGSRRNSKMPRRNAFVNVKKPIANRASLTMTCLTLSLVVERVM